jgi:hypothetical protein
MSSPENTPTGVQLCDTYPARAAQGSQHIVAELKQYTTEDIMSSEGRLVVPLALPTVLQNVSHGDSQAQRIVNIMKRNGHDTQIPVVIGSSFISPNSEIENLYSVCANIEVDDKEFLRSESELVNGLLTRWNLRKRGLIPAFFITTALFGRDEAIGLAELMQLYSGTPVTLSEPTVVEVEKSNN